MLQSHTFWPKNASTTDHRLDNKMFSYLIGQSIEVYVNDMTVKIKQTKDYVTHLRETLDILKKYGIKLNPNKCVYEVSLGNFFGFMANQRGFETNLRK